MDKRFASPPVFPCQPTGVSSQIRERNLPRGMGFVECDRRVLFPRWFEIPRRTVETLDVEVELVEGMHEVFPHDFASRVFLGRGWEQRGHDLVGSVG